MCADLVARQRGCKTIGRKDVWKIRKKVGNTLRGGEESSSERRKQRRQRGKAQGRRRASKNPLVGHPQKKIVIAEKVRPKDRNVDLSQLKKPLKTAGTKT